MKRNLLIILYIIVQVVFSDQILATPQAQIVKLLDRYGYKIIVPGKSYIKAHKELYHNNDCIGRNIIKVRLLQNGNYKVCTIQNREKVTFSDKIFSSEQELQQHIAMITCLLPKDI